MNLLILKSIAFSFISLFTGNNPVMEQAKSDFAKVNQSFMLPAYSVQMTYSYYKQEKDAKAYEIKTGMFYKEGSNSYSNISGIESVRLKDISIAVQHEDKIMVLSNAIAKSPAISLGADSLLRFCSSVNRTELPDGGIKYDLGFDKRYDVEFEKMEVYFDKKNYFLTKLVMIYAAQEVPSENTADETESIKPKIEVAYKNFTTKPVLQKNLFVESSYVKQLSPKKYLPAGKYAGYTVYNQKFK